ncbi:hypothetical protein YC2023_019222 [Brassica napus]
MEFLRRRRLLSVFLVFKQRKGCEEAEKISVTNDEAKDSSSSKLIIQQYMPKKGFAGQNLEPFILLSNIKAELRPRIEWKKLKKETKLVSVKQKRERKHNFIEVKNEITYWESIVWTQKSRTLFEYLSFWPQGHVIGGELVCLSKSDSFSTELESIISVLDLLVPIYRHKIHLPERCGPGILLGMNPNTCMLNRILTLTLTLTLTIILSLVTPPLSIPFLNEVLRQLLFYKSSLSSEVNLVYVTCFCD